MKKKISAVITDIDNTLFDWLKIWYNSFQPMLAKIEEISNISSDVLIKEIQQIHQKYGTSEYSQLIQEIPSIQNNTTVQEILKKYDPAIHAYRKGKKSNLKLYDGVLKTLLELKSRGCIIVAYTDSMSYYTADRLQRLGLDGLIDCIYSPPDHELPAYFTGKTNILKKTIHKHLKKGELKPNPLILKDIILDIGIRASECIYIGDNKFKDIAMAQEAGIIDIHAQYGESHKSLEYDLLKQVTHWPKDAIIIESSTKVKPTYKISDFSEILDIFDFVPPDRSERNKRLLEEWKTSVDVQKHFNDICIRVRTLAFTFLGALVGAISYTLLKEGGTYIRSDKSDLIIMVTSFCLSLIWYGFYMMDKKWYHLFLESLGRKAEVIENLLELNLSKNISAASKESKIFWFRCRSSNRLEIFWSIGLFVLLLPILYFLLEKAALVFLYILTQSSAIQ